MAPASIGQQAAWAPTGGKEDIRFCGETGFETRLSDRLICDLSFILTAICLALRRTLQFLLLDLFYTNPDLGKKFIFCFLLSSLNLYTCALYISL